MNITTFNSLKSRNYRLYFVGQSLSLIGTWMQKTAVSWVIYSLTGSKFMLGLSVFATLFPTALFSLFGGIVADRFDRYTVLLLTQIASMVQAVLLTLAIVFFRDNAVWLIIALSAVLGIINGFDVPARQALVRELVNDERDLPNALALNSSMVNLSKLIGPAIAGFVLEQYGDEVCFGLNAVSFVAVIGSVLMMRLPRHKAMAREDRNINREFREAFGYIKHTPVVSSVIIFVALMSFLVLPFTTLTPVYAKDIFNGGASTLGVIDGFIGLGAFAGAVFLASLKQGVDLSRVLAINTLIFGVGLALFSYTSWFPLALAFVVLGAFGMMSVRTVTNTIIQLNAPQELRGRVISIFIMVLTAMLPLGSLLVGAASHYVGVENTVLIQGITAIVIAAIYGRYLRKQRLRKREAHALEHPRGELLDRA